MPQQLVGYVPDALQVESADAVQDALEYTWIVT